MLTLFVHLWKCQHSLTSVLSDKKDTSHLIQLVFPHSWKGHLLFNLLCIISKQQIILEINAYCSDCTGKEDTVSSLNKLFQNVKVQMFTTTLQQIILSVLHTYTHKSRILQRNILILFFSVSRMCSLSLENISQI